MTSRIKKIFASVVFFFFLAFFALFSLGNKSSIKINLFPFPFFIELPVYLLVILLLFIGFTLGFVFVHLKKVFGKS